MSGFEAKGPVSPLDPVPLQDRFGLVFWPRQDIALLRVDLSGRVEATSATGEVAHRPGPLESLEGAPWIRLPGGELVHPGRVRRVRGGVLVPGGRRLEGVSVPAPPPPCQPVAPIPGTRLRPPDVLYLQGADGTAFWMTDQGRVDAGPSAERAARLHPTLVKAGRGTYVNRMRLRAIRCERKRFRLVLDEGTELTVSFGARGPLARGLGLAQLDALEPTNPQWAALYREGVRSWPDELYRTPASRLRASFGDDVRRLMADVIWQAFELRSAGVVAEYGEDHRGFWYVPLVTVLERAGQFQRRTPLYLSDGPGGGPPDGRESCGPWALNLAGGHLGAAAAPDGQESCGPWAMPSGVAALMGGSSAALLECDSPRAALEAFWGEDGRDWLLRRAGDPDATYRLFELLIATMVGEDRLFTYADLGFVEPRPELRGVGTTRPDVVLLGEKTSLRRGVDAVRQARGTSHILLGGLPSLLSTEFFVRALRDAGVRGPLTLLAYVDFDPGGWIATDAFVAQLARYGMSVARVGFLVRPSRFTRQELKLFSMPLPAPTPQVLGKVRAWVRRSGGIHGRPMGVHADHLWPPSRVLQAFDAEMASLSG